MPETPDEEFLGGLIVGGLHVDEFFEEGRQQSVGELPIVRVEYEEAQQLADLTAIFRDLKFVREVLQRLLRLLDENSEDHVLIQSYWTAGLIAYVRCFATGVRFGLREDVFKQREGAVEVHQFVRGLRDKHIAHSVNPFEQTAVGLILSEPTATERKVEGVAALAATHIIADREGVNSFLAIVGMAMQHVKEEAERSRARTLQVGQQLPIDDLYLRERLRVTAPGPQDASRAR